MTILDFWKYAWKTLDEVAQSNINYIYRLYREKISARELNHELVMELEDIKKKYPLEMQEFIQFWKYNWLSFKELFKKDNNYITYILREEEQKKWLRSESLIYTIKQLILQHFEENIKNK
jgi:hypothetical protein